MQTLQLLGLNEALLHQFALATTFKKRVRKLSGLDYILMILLNASKDIMSYNTLASSFNNTPSKCVNKQALQRAMKNNNFLQFIDMVFDSILMKKIRYPDAKFKAMFSRIVIQDSTIVKLPQRLFAFYGGIKNQCAQVANSRIQFTIDILRNTFIGISIDSYSTNDAKAAKNLKPQKKDLILRDRGYFLINEIVRIIEAKAFFIYRYHPSYNYSDIQTGKVLDLYEIFKKKKYIDMHVRMGLKDGPIVRLLAMPIDENTASHRRFIMKRDRRNNPSKNRLALLSWSIYITNIDDTKVTCFEIFELYKLRWRIEIIFKALKSNLKLDSIHNVSEIQFKFIVKAKIIMIVLAIQFVYEPLLTTVKELYNKELSLLKLVRFITDNNHLLKSLIEHIKARKKGECNDLNILSLYCCYDKRKQKNHENNFISALS